MTTNPKFLQLLALLIDHRGLTVSAAASLLDLPHFMVLRFANRLIRLGYATQVQGSYFVTISGREIDAVMQGRLR
jgi:DNA-binding IclR family transcriptional regulator